MHVLAVDSLPLPAAAAAVEPAALAMPGPIAVVALAAPLPAAALGAVMAVMPDVVPIAMPIAPELLDAGALAAFMPAPPPLTAAAFAPAPLLVLVPDAAGVLALGPAFAEPCVAALAPPSVVPEPEQPPSTLAHRALPTTAAKRKTLL